LVDVVLKSVIIIACKRDVTESLIPGSRVFIVPGGSEGPERLSLPFPFSSKRRKEGGVGAIGSAGKERRRSSPLFPKASAQKPIRIILGESGVILSKSDAGTFREGEIM